MCAIDLQYLLYVLMHLGKSLITLVHGCIDEAKLGKVHYTKAHSRGQTVDNCLHGIYRLS